MHRNSRDLAHAGLYLGCLAMLALAAAGGAVSAALHMPESRLLATAAEAIAPSQNEETTHIGRIVANAREIRAALARPVAGPEPLPPITAKLAFGHLKPGGKGAIVAHRKRKPIDPAAMDAMAMAPAAMAMAPAAMAPAGSVPGLGQPFGGGGLFGNPTRTSEAPRPELHKVY